MSKRWTLTIELGGPDGEAVVLDLVTNWLDYTLSTDAIEPLWLVDWTLDEKE